MRRLALLVLVALPACGLFRDPPPSHYPTQEVYAEDTTLGPRDVFQVRVFRHDEMSGDYEVSEEGTINFPEIGLVAVEGRTPAQVEKEIQTRLADGYLVNPSVSVLVKEYKSKTISVLGQVRRPTTIAYAAGMSIVDAISQAGGFTPMARKNAVKVTRVERGAPADEAPGEPAPAPAPADEGASADEAAPGKARTVSFTVPVEAIANGKAEPFFLRPGDTIFVPERWY
jgi:protein involved in polysaccharide export with SLBB domain